MARPIQYEMDKILPQLMNLYWEKGYEATSIKDITNLTGLKPGSLYKIFENKEGIFEAAMDLYISNNTQALSKIFENEDTPLENIETFLSEFIFSAITNENIKGCLLVKTLLITTHTDKKVQAYIVESFAQTEKLLEKTLTMAKQKQLSHVDPKDFSKFIINTIYGAHVYYKANHDAKVLAQTMQYVLDLLSKNKG